jgi:hypothetical protein
MIQITSYSPVTPIQQVGAVNGKNDQKESIKAIDSKKDSVEISEKAQESFEASQSKSADTEFNEKETSKPKTNIFSSVSKEEVTLTTPIKPTQPTPSAEKIETKEQIEKKTSEKESFSEKIRQNEESPIAIFSKTVKSFTSTPPDSGSILNLVI